MAYSKQNFQDGQILSAANLEAMEDGIIAGQGAYNFLDNSDFSNPVNSQGKTSYTGAGYTIDRWKAGTADCSMYVNAGKFVAFNTKTEGVNAYWRQYLPYSLSQLEGKTFTLAIKDTWGKTHCASGVYPTSAPSDTKSVIWINMYENISFVLYCAKDGTAFIQLTTKKSVPIVWAALYEGSYDASTLPSYVPKDKHMEMLNCNVPLAPHNLLDNSDFRNPVNQRGITSRVGGGYGLDRWRADGSGTISVESTGVSLTNLSFRQPVPLKAGTYTLAFHLSNGKTLGYVFKFDGSSTLTAINSSWNETTGAYINYYKHSTGVVTVQIVVAEGYTIILDWAALYEGSYTADTLPAYQPKGYAAELAECQRYYYQTWNGVLSSTSNANGIIVRQCMSLSRLANVELPCIMRITPTITMYTSDAHMNAVRNWNDSNDEVSGMTIVYANNKSFIPANEASGLTLGKWYSFHYSASADL